MPIIDAKTRDKIPHKVLYPSLGFIMFCTRHSVNFVSDSMYREITFCIQNMVLDPTLGSVFDDNVHEFFKISQNVDSAKSAET